MKRRQVLKLFSAVCATVFAASSQAQESVIAPEGEAGSQPSVYVVKIISFACNFCRESEAADKMLITELARENGSLVVAPLDVNSPHPTFAREYVFYAARDFGPRVYEAVKDSLYKGTQDRGLQFAGVAQVIAWLQSDVPDILEAAGWAKLARRAESPSVREALGRAVRLAVGAGVDHLPAYLLLHDGRVMGLYDRGSFPGPAILRERLLERVRTLNRRSATSVAESS